MQGNFAEMLANKPSISSAGNSKPLLMERPILIQEKPMSYKYALSG